MENNREIVILYTKYPLPGHSKTRLISKLGPDGAAGLQKKMSVEMLSKLNTLQLDRPIKIVIHFDGGTHELMEKWLGSLQQFCRQSDGDLGVRMTRSISRYLPAFSRIILVGSDCPGISELIIREVLDSLEKMIWSSALPLTAVII